MLVRGNFDDNEDEGSDDEAKEAARMSLSDLAAEALTVKTMS